MARKIENQWTVTRQQLMSLMHTQKLQLSTDHTVIRYAGAY